MKTEYAMEWYSNENLTWNEQSRHRTLKELRAEARRYYRAWKDWGTENKRGHWRVTKITRKVIGSV